MSSPQTVDGLRRLPVEESGFFWRAWSALTGPGLVLSFKEKCEVNLVWLDLSAEYASAVEVSFVEDPGRSSKRLSGVASCFLKLH